MESNLGDAACLVDEYERDRILDLCVKFRASCGRLDEAERKGKLQMELQKAATDQQPWQDPAATSNGTGTLPQLLHPRVFVLLSYWD